MNDEAHVLVGVLVLVKVKRDVAVAIRARDRLGSAHVGPPLDACHDAGRHTYSVEAENLQREQLERIPRRAIVRQPERGRRQRPGGEQAVAPQGVERAAPR